nr:hypothetical protein [uncultured Rhodoferax sp.]
MLHNVRNKDISQATRERVLAVARELGHGPHAASTDEEGPDPSAFLDLIRSRPGGQAHNGLGA